MPHPLVLRITAALLAVFAGALPHTAAVAAPIVRMHHAVSTHDARAQTLFDRGLTAYYAYNHPEAERLFRAARAQDPGLAMASWGIAIANGPTINFTPGAAQTRTALAALAEAQRVGSDATPADRAYIDALAARYPGGRLSEQPYSFALRRLTATYPNDPDAATLYGESILNRYGPAGMWSPDGRTPAPGTAGAVPALQRALALQPDHEGAGHFLIHAVEASPAHKRLALAISNSMTFAAVDPENAHFVHMPSHIYDQVGDLHTAIVANVRAIALFHRYLHGGLPRTRGDVDYEHFLRFLMRMYGLAGQNAEAVRVARGYVDEIGSNAPLLIVLVQTRGWREILRQPAPMMQMQMMGDPPQVYRFARGMAFARFGRIADAQHEYAYLPHLTAFPTAAAHQTSLMRDYLGAVIAQERGDTAAAVTLLSQARAHERALPYSEVPYWWFPLPSTLAL